MADSNQADENLDQEPTIHDTRSGNESPSRDPHHRQEDEWERTFFCEPQPTTSPLRAEVRECDWNQFKNFDSNRPLCVIDTLVAGPNLGLQVLDEAIRRQPYDAESKYKWTRSPLAYSKWIPSQQKWIHRIRIRSAVVLKLLNEASGDNWDISRAHIFMRPFGYLIFHHEAIKNKVAAKDQVNTHMQSVSDMEELRCYIEFVDNILLPLYKQFEASDKGSTKVRFDDLWYLFRPSELIYAHPPENNNFSTLRGRDSYAGVAQKIWRVADIRPHEGVVRSHTVFTETFSPGPGDGSDSEEDQDPTEAGAIWFSGPQPPRRIVGWFTLYCYYIDFNGDNYFPVWKIIAVPPFIGERSISSLSVYPVRFAPESGALRQKAILQGKKFLDCVRRRYLWHKGWFVMAEPDGRPMLTSKGEPTHETTEHTGQVFVDVKEALNHRLQWRTWSHGCRPYEIGSRTTIESFAIVTSTNPPRQRVVSSPYEILVLNDDVHRFEFNKYLKTDQYISGQEGLDAKSFPLKEDDLALLPRRLYVYLLRNHFFIPVDINDLKPLQFQANAFDDVIFKQNSPMKDRINALLDAYFERKKLSEDTRTLAADDIVHGKATGLVILLQGTPGTGKTATVEAIAQSRGKPLIIIGPEDVDDDIELNMIFNVAAKWDCIVLFDEVDVLLGRRNHQNFGGNIWVSRLLRYLETFSGILFLTTMRAGAFDEGVKSRVHLSVCYQPLDEEQTVNIFKVHLKCLERMETLQHEASETYIPLGIDEEDIIKFAREHYNTNSVKLGRWNGRQIRNAVRVAAAIAHYDYRGKRLQPQLRGEQFRIVAQMTKEYDEIRYNTLGYTDGGYALSARERYDVDPERALPSNNKALQPAGAVGNQRPTLPRSRPSPNWGAGFQGEEVARREMTVTPNPNEIPIPYEDGDCTDRVPRPAAQPGFGERGTGRDLLTAGDDPAGERHYGGFGPSTRPSGGLGPSVGYNKKVVENIWGHEG